MTTAIRLQWETTAAAGPLYRYLSAEFARSMVEDGRMRVTTLHACRASEIGDARVDKDEGCFWAVDASEDVTVTTNDALPPFARRHLSVTEGRPTRLNGVVFQEDADSDDHFILCLSRTFSAELFEKFEVDACVQILDPLLFFKRTTIALGYRVAGDATLFPIQYGRRTGRFQDVANIHPVWKKHPRYASEEEVRMLWTPTSRPIAPQLVTLTRCAESLRVLHRRDVG